MPSFTKVDPSSIVRTRSREGKVSTALVASFLDATTEGDVVQVDVTDTDKKMESVRSTVSNYVRRHELPVKVFTANGSLYMERSEAQKAEYAKLNADAEAKAKSNGQSAAPAPASAEAPAQ